MQRLFWALTALFSFAAWHASDLYPPWLKFQSEAWAGLALVMLALSQRCSPVTPQVAIRRPQALSLFLLAVPLLAGLHVLTSATVYLGDAALLSLYALGALLALLLGQQLTAGADEHRLIKGLSLLLVASALCSVAEALYQWLMLDGLGHWVLPIPVGARPSGNFAQANRMAMHTATGLAALVWLYRKQVIGCVGLVFAALFICVGIALSQSRAGLFASVVVLLLAAVMQRRGWRAGAIYLALVCVALMLFWMLPAISQSMDLGAVRTHRLALGSRGTLLAGFAQSTLEKPWWGYGPGQIIHAQFLLAGQGLPAKVSFWSHHVLLDFALLFGLPVMVAFLACLSLFAYELLGDLRHERNQFVLMALTPFVVMLNTEYPHAYLNSLLLFAFIAGMIKSKTKACTWGALQVNKVINALLLIFCALAGGIYYDYQRLETAFQVARFEALRAGSFPVGYKYPSALVLDNLEALVALVRRKEFRNLTAAELIAYRRSVMRFPYESALRGYAVATALNAPPDAQIEALKEIDAFYGKFAQRAAERAIKRNQD